MISEINNIIKYLIQHNHCTSGDQIRSLVAPFASGSKNGCLRIPFPNVLKGNRGCESWCSMLMMYNAENLDYWLALACYSKEVPIETFLLAQANLETTTKLLPCVYYTEVPYKVSCRSINIYELIKECNMQTVMHLLEYLWGIVIFGMYMNEGIITSVFEIENLPQYFASRLFEGAVDKALAFGGHTSYFSNLYSTTMQYYSSQELYNAMSKQQHELQDFSMLILKEKQKIESCTFLGNDTTQVIAMKEALKLSHAYSHYLETETGFYKVGSKLFEQIVTANSGMSNVLNAAPENVEVKFPILSTNTIPNKLMINKSAPASFSLFGGSSTMVCDFGGASTQSKPYISNTANNFQSNDIRLF